MQTNANQTHNTEQKAHRKVESAAAGAHQAVDWAADTASNAQESLSETGHELRQTQEKWLAVAREYVQENPVTAVSMALAGGYLFSQIFRR